MATAPGEVVVRLSLGVSVVVSGGEPIREPLHWPVFFAVDDPALRFLAGDVGSSDWLHAPGPSSSGDRAEPGGSGPRGPEDPDQRSERTRGKGCAGRLYEIQPPSGALPAWARDVASQGVAGAGYLGFGLVYSDGGATDEATRAAYQELTALVQALALDHVARASGLGALLGAFGGTSFEAGRGPQLDRLRDGVDPEKLPGELDPGLVSSAGAFRAVRDSLLPFTPGVPAASSTVGKPTSLAAAPVRRIAQVEPARVVAVTVQAWRVEEIAAKGALEIRRDLPVRGGRKVKLTLQGRVGQDGR